jgi:hypothetical protein
MMRRPYWPAFLLASWLVPAQSAFAKVTVTVAFATTNSTAPHRGFSGFNIAATNRHYSTFPAGPFRYYRITVP